MLLLRQIGQRGSFEIQAVRGSLSEWSCRTFHFFWVDVKASLSVRTHLWPEWSMRINDDLKSCTKRLVSLQK